MCRPYSQMGYSFDAETVKMSWAKNHWRYSGLRGFYILNNFGANRRGLGNFYIFGFRDRSVVLNGGFGQEHGTGLIWSH
jgi:hypothetical protein